eukprot:GFKZ01009681.1.p1 GENE.GFKZ01009681.1~~GFKZ01009681.1.p1  ORF type:complete len:324 (+),score=64.98 GFKZ01009681.1:111-974(+)
MAETRLRYRRIAPEARSGSLGSLGNHFPARFEFPHRPSLLESLTSDDETLSFGVRIKKEKTKKPKRKRKSKPSPDTPPHRSHDSHNDDDDDVSTSLTTQGGSAEFGPDDLPLVTAATTAPTPVAQAQSSRNQQRGKPPSHPKTGVKWERKIRKKGEGKGVGKARGTGDCAITTSLDGRPISAPEAMSPEMRAAFVMVAEEPVVYRGGKGEKEREDRKGERVKKVKKSRAVEERAGEDFERERELSVSFAHRRYTAEEAAAVKPLNAIQRLFQAIALAKVTGLRGGRR